MRVLIKKGISLSHLLKFLPISNSANSSLLCLQRHHPPPPPAPCLEISFAAISHQLPPAKILFLPFSNIPLYPKCMLQANGFKDFCYLKFLHLVSQVSNWQINQLMNPQHAKKMQRNHLFMYWASTMVSSSSNVVALSITMLFENQSTFHKDSKASKKISHHNRI